MRTVSQNDNQTHKFVTFPP